MRTSRTLRRNPSDLVSLANNIMNGEQEITELKQKQFDEALKGLEILRHQALMKKNDKQAKKQQERAEQFIAQITHLKNQHKPKTAAPSHTSRMDRLRQSQPVPATVRQIELTQEEKDILNQKVDEILSGFELTGVDQEYIPKMNHVLKERKEALINQGKYKEAEIIDKNIRILLGFQTKRVSADPRYDAEAAEKKTQEQIARYELMIAQARKRISVIKETYQQDLAKLNQDKEMSASRTFTENERMINEIEAMKEEVEMGIGFKQSKKLLELRKTQEGLARAAMFEEAIRVQKDADQLEFEERSAFESERKKAIELIEKRLNKEHKTNDEHSGQFWERKKNKLSLKLKKDVAEIRSEIRRLKEKITSLTGEDYVEKSCHDSDSLATSQTEATKEEEELIEEETKAEETENELEE